MVKLLKIVAEKYYGDPYRFWIVLLSNELLNPLWDWPLSDNMFLDYINTKYETDAEAENETPFVYTNTTVYQYQKIITTKNSDSGIENITKVPMTLTQYNTLTPSITNFDLLDGSATVSITKKIITIYDYESELNDNKRQIKLLNSGYVTNFENSFKTIMEA